MTPKMRQTLEAIYPHENIIDAGTTAGMVEASGGTRSCLYRAVRLGWVNKYPKSQGFYETEMQNTPRYYLTKEGAEALKEN